MFKKLIDAIKGSMAGGAQGVTHYLGSLHAFSEYAVQVSTTLNFLSNFLLMCLGGWKQHLQCFGSRQVENQNGAPDTWLSKIIYLAILDIRRENQQG